MLWDFVILEGYCGLAQNSKIKGALYWITTIWQALPIYFPLYWQRSLQDKSQAHFVADEMIAAQ